MSQLRLRALATDYDGTIAHHGTVPPATLQALQRLKAAGFCLILVTGRELNELRAIFPELSWFDLAVVENGGVIYHPASGKIELLAGGPPEKFIASLRAASIPVQVGHSIVATWEPHEKRVLDIIRDLCLELQVIFNKGAVMILPTGVNKATGLIAACQQLGLEPAECAGVGDAENDHSFLDICGFSCAVANALPVIKEKVHLVTQKDHGDGVNELIERLIAANAQGSATEAPATEVPA